MWWWLLCLVVVLRLSLDFELECVWVDDVEWRSWEQGEGIYGQMGNLREHRIIDCFVVNIELVGVKKGIVLTMQIKDEHNSLSPSHCYNRAFRSGWPHSLSKGEL